MREKTHVIIWISFFSILYGIFDANLTSALFSILGAFFPNMDWLVDKARFEGVKILIAKRMRGSASELRGMVFHNIWALIAFSLLIRWVVSDNLLPTLFFMSGYFGHLIADSLTKSGIYWLWPYGHILGTNGKFYSGGPISDEGSKEFLLQAAIIALASLIFVLKFNVT